MATLTRVQWCQHCSDLRQHCSLIEQTSVNTLNPMNVPDDDIEVPIAPITPKPASLIETIHNVLMPGKCKLDQCSLEALTRTSPTCSKHTIRLPPQKKASKGSLTQCSPLEGSPSLFSDNCLIASVPDIGSLQSMVGCQGPYLMGPPSSLAPSLYSSFLASSSSVYSSSDPYAIILNINFMPLKRIFVSCKTWSNFTKIRLMSCWLVRMKRCTWHVFELLS